MLLIMIVHYALLEYWRQHGPYGRLRNIITYICWTPQRRDEFIQLTREFPPDTTAALFQLQQIKNPLE